jgi:hypothetical protein
LMDVKIVLLALARRSGSQRLQIKRFEATDLENPQATPSWESFIY